MRNLASVAANRNGTRIVAPGHHGLSIIAVALNEAKHIVRWKAAVDALLVPKGISVETLLVDGGSEDGTVDAARSAGLDKVLVLPGASIPVCRNAGAAEASGCWLAYVDADCELSPTWLQTAAPLLANHTAIVLGWPAEPPSPPTWVQEAWQVHWLYKHPLREQFDGRPAILRDAFRLITTRNMLMSRTVFTSLKGFDERLATGEDTDFAFRATQQGSTVVALPGLEVTHHGEPRTWKAFYRQQVWHANRGSYGRILAEGGGRKGAHAVWFAVAFLVTAMAAVTGILLVGLTGSWRYVVAVVPWCLLLILPASCMSIRAGTLRYVAPLTLLYALYGCARVLDLVGLHRSKSSWKA